MNFTFVEEPGQLSAVVPELAAAEQIALDVEADGLYRYRARLCTLQLATPSRVIIVDTLAVRDLAPLTDVLSSVRPRKVIHDATLDVRMLHAVGLLVRNVFDTAVAARFLGEPATGLSQLLALRLGVELKKEQQRADWGRRPLGDDQLTYLVQDVSHLLELGASIEADVVARGIEAEVLEETAYLLRRAQETKTNAPPWTSIKGVRELPSLSRSVLRELALVRERVAERWDVPPFRVISSETLVTLAKQRPRNVGELGRVRGMPGGRSRSITGELLQAIRVGESKGNPPDDETARVDRPMPSAEERALRRSREQLLTKWRRGEAERRGVDPQVVLPGHCLQQLLASDIESLEQLDAIDGFGAFRVSRYGDTILENLRLAGAATGEANTSSGPTRDGSSGTLF